MSVVSLSLVFAADSSRLRVRILANEAVHEQQVLISDVTDNDVDVTAALLQNEAVHEQQVSISDVTDNDVDATASLLQKEAVHEQQVSISDVTDDVDAAAGLLQCAYWNARQAADVPKPPMDSDGNSVVGIALKFAEHGRGKIESVLRVSKASVTSTAKVFIEKLKSAVDRGVERSRPLLAEISLSKAQQAAGNAVIAPNLTKIKDATKTTLNQVGAWAEATYEDVCQTYINNKQKVPPTA
eukprot:CAMPEP_0119313286 /NCGR_PEP_ID=MMETSP1333-20130426/28594_1 /TAXON_ID=418940 /ORGANISM="Scyphosphaera apsteinii, Strain RCC1455" /LENGTH=240 /DNA_ID=CAMNT_0007318089 /DNA_START=37 /DNA_END=759 /DNA_ORIENTATION=-